MHIWLKYDKCILCFLYSFQGCRTAYFNITRNETGYPFNLLMSGAPQTKLDLDLTNPYYEDPSDANWDNLYTNITNRIRACSWSNQFAFPWEIGMYWDFQVGKPGHRAIGELKSLL